MIWHYEKKFHKVHSMSNGKCENAGGMMCEIAVNIESFFVEILRSMTVSNVLA
jgi:hypothetical protein